MSEKTDSSISLTYQQIQKTERTVHMRDCTQIDPDLYRLFVESRVWQQYAQKYLLPEQLDVEDIAPYL